MRHLLIFRVSESLLLSECTEDIFNEAMKYLKNKHKNSCYAFVCNVQ